MRALVFAVLSLLWHSDLLATESSVQEAQSSEEIRSSDSAKGAARDQSLSALPAETAPEETAQTPMVSFPQSNVTVSEASNWPFVMLTLLGMVVCILLIAWFVKRFAGLSALGGRDLKVVSTIAIGARERVAIIDVKGEQFLIGATQQNINLLHHFDQAPIATQNNSGHGDSTRSAPSEFAQKLQGILNSKSTESEQK